ncbi:BRCT domain-containing protein [Shewanella basaltis]|uniref:BRCT domain-containing protein n=1 Tax=Shewanella basaltis TaxID=472183 RepID=UPI003AAFD40C
MSGLEICFTGFAKQDRAQLEELATDSGFIVRKAVTKNLHMLCAGKNAGPNKIAAALSDGAAIFDQSEFIALTKTGELSDENFAKLNTLMRKRDDDLRNTQFNKYQANFSEAFLVSEILKIKQTQCASNHPYVENVENIDFKNTFTCFTGEFESCNSREVIQAVSAYKGAFIDQYVSLRTKYLVVGGLGSIEWSKGEYGSKIERALELKAKGYEVFIISEAQWMSAI